jgi:hypothetical protein
VQTHGREARISKNSLNLLKYEKKYFIIKTHRLRLNEAKTEQKQLRLNEAEWRIQCTE